MLGKIKTQICKRENSKNGQADLKKSELLEIKITEIKNSTEVYKSRLDTAKERIPKSEDRTEGIPQNAAQGEKR